MFYETNEINDILLCQQCQGRLEGPKLLPCGETICSFCVSTIQINSNNFKNNLITVFQIYDFVIDFNMCRFIF